MAFLCSLMLSGLILFPIVVNMLNVVNGRPVSEEQREITCRENEKEKQVRNDPSGVDMISNLPSGILENIFRYMPLEEIVRTSILSRDWRYKWVTCPEIVVDFDRDFLRQHDLIPIMFNILSHHQGPLSKFIFDMPDFESCPEINEWIQLLPNNTLQEFALCVRDEELHHLGSHLSSFQNLRKLNLDNCEFDPPFEGFKNLVILKLTCVDFLPQRFVKCIASCPALEALDLEGCTDFDCLEIAGPKMKLFRFYGLYKSISFKNCPLLKAVSLYVLPFGFLEPAVGFSFNLVKSLSGLPALEELKLQACVLQDLVNYGAPNKLPIALKKLKKFKLCDMNFQTIAEISSAICFIRSCPNLESLNIKSFVLEVEDAVADFLRSLNQSKCLTKLKCVRIRYFKGYEPEMEFAKFLLASSTVLEELLITHPRNNFMARVDSIMDKLDQYPRASPMVNLIARSY